jgi:D-3-phosphoglycerate dehydrogenase
MKQGGASRFIAFTENIERASAVDNADQVAPNFDEVLFTHGIKASVSYPKNRIEIASLVECAQVKEPFITEGFTYHPAAVAF